jgi:hypothetical protein
MSACATMPHSRPLASTTGMRRTCADSIAAQTSAKLVSIGTLRTGEVM